MSARAKKRSNSPIRKKINSSFILGWAGFICALCSIVISIWAVFKSEEIAERSGAFDKGELRFTFGGYEIRPDTAITVYYAARLNDSLIRFTTLPTGVFNSGKKNVTDIQLLIKYPHLSRIAVMDSLLKINTVFGDRITRRTMQNEPFDEVLFSLQSLPPNTGEPLKDLFVMRRETADSLTVPVTTKDSNTINFHVQYSFGYPVLMRLTATDITSKNYFFTVSLVNETDPNKVVNKIVMEQLSELEKKNKPLHPFFVVLPLWQKNLGSSQYPIHLLDAKDNQVILCLFSTDNKYLFSANKDGTIQQVVELDSLRLK